MEAFTYKGISDGKYVEGDIEAINLDEASHLLKEKKIIITNIIRTKKKKADEKKKSKGLSFLGGKKKVKVEDILIFSKQFATMVKAGLPILQVLAMLRDQMENPGIKDIIEDIRKSLEGGITLSKCFEKYPETFDSIYINLIKAGEASGKLDVFLMKLVESLEKREKVKKKIKSTAKSIFLLHQIHSNKFVYINEKNKFRSKPKADAVITNQKNMPIGVLTADCVPILICDERTKLVAAIHAGWKGAYKDIISKVIQFMIKKGSNPKNITAAIGPAISAKNYEVKQDFKRKFIKKDKKNNKFFKIKYKKLYFDLPQYVKSCLLKNKIKNIESLNVDTFDINNNFFSARRALRLNHDDYGRNISIIMLY